MISIKRFSSFSYLLPIFLLSIFAYNPFFKASSQDRSVRSVSFAEDGHERTYYLHLPPQGTPGKKYPLLIVLHGGGGNGKGMIKLTRGRFNELADRDSFIVIYPDGINKHWNDGREGIETGYSSQENNVDDVAFLSALMDKMISEQHADEKRIYVTGMSNGAMMTYRAGCALGARIAAIAPVAGDIPEHLLQVCKPGKPVSVLAINNTNDPLMPYNGGEVTGPFGRRKLGKVLSARESVIAWVKTDGCEDPPMLTDVPDQDPSDGTRIQKECWANGRNHTEVILYTVDGGGHTWPGGLQYLGEGLVGKTSRDMNACDQIWEFCKKHSLAY